MSTAELTCPHCDASMRGGEIPAEHRVHKSNHDDQVERYGRCYCFPYGEQTHWSRVIGHEVWGVYDGILFWVCPDCGLAWSRWTDGGRLTDAAAEYVDKYNAAVSA